MSVLRAAALLAASLCFGPAGAAKTDSSHDAVAPAVMILGDSLSTAYGIPREKGWVALLAERLARRTRAFRVVNVSISGETTAGGASRVEQALARHAPEVLVVELGGNDGLQGLPLEATRRNLDAIVRAGLAAGARVLLLGVELPPNYGPAYTKRFREIYSELASAHGVPLLPFVLEGVALEASLMQADGIHPVAEAQPIILGNVWPHLEPLL